MELAPGPWERRRVALNARVQEDGRLGCKPLKHVRRRPLRLWGLDQSTFGRLSPGWGGGGGCSPHPHAHRRTHRADTPGPAGHRQGTGTSWPKEPLRLSGRLRLSAPVTPSAPSTAWPASFSGGVHAPLTGRQGAGLQPGSGAPTGGPLRARPPGTPSPRTRHPCGLAGATCPHRPPPSPPSCSASQAQGTASRLPGLETIIL